MDRDAPWPDGNRQPAQHRARHGPDFPAAERDVASAATANEAIPSLVLGEMPATCMRFQNAKSVKFSPVFERRDALCIHGVPSTASSR